MRTLLTIAVVIVVARMTYLAIKEKTKEIVPMPDIEPIKIVVEQEVRTIRDSFDSWNS